MISGAANAAPDIFRFASPRDTAIVTNSGLIELDPGLPRVGELAHRLDRALQQRKVLIHIANTQSRSFALGSVTLNGSRDIILDFQTTLQRQSEFVSFSFGPLAINDLPVFVATSIDASRNVLGPVLDTLAYITCSSGFWRDAEVIDSRDVFCMAGATRKRDTIDLITLWPLKA